MDRKNNFLVKFKSFINSLDDDYLIGISNKGTVNRSKKDLEKVQSITYEIQDENIEFIVDDIKCLVSNDVQKYKCSCPSRSICKHIIICYLYMINNKENIFNISEEDTNKNKYLNDCKENSLSKSNENNTDNKNEIKREFLKLKEYSVDKIIKEIGERKLIEIIRRIEFGIEYTISEKSIITVDFGEEQIIVKLVDEIENSVCTCKSKGLCIHKAEALILYKLYKNYLTLEELNSYNFNKSYIDEKIIKKAGNEIRSLIEEILISGICRLPETILDSINNMAVKCHNYNLPNFEKILRRIKEEISLYFNKNSSFQNERLLDILTSLYTKTIILESTKDLNKITEIIGEFKSSYYNMPTIELHGIGEEKWLSKSGYKGTTYYFFDNNRKTIFTFTKSMATYYDNEVKMNVNTLNNSVPWDLNCSLSELSKIHFKLISGKINSQNRISSSNESKGVIIDKSNLEKLNIENYIFDNWKTIIDEVFLKKKLDNENFNLVFIKGKQFGECTFDNITQTFILEIQDIDNNVLEIDIKFSIESKIMIKTLERLYKNNIVSIFFGRTYIKDGKIKFYPISYYKNNEVKNLNS